MKLHFNLSTTIASAALISMVTFSSSVFADATQDGPRAILPMHKTSKMVEFDHTRHENFSCADCHHENDPSQTFQPYQCSSCHSTEKADKKADNSYFNIIHGKKAKADDLGKRCMACHLEQKAKGAMTEDMTSCKSCHQ